MASDVASPYPAASRTTIYYALILILSSVFMRDVFNTLVSAIGRNNLVLLVWLAFSAGTFALYLYCIRLERERLWFFLVLMIAGLLYAASFEIFEERVHLIKYGLLGAMLCADQKRRFRPTALVVIGIIGAGIVGGLDELLQSVSPGRVGDWRDLLFDSVGGLWGSLIFMVLPKKS